jgi:hypothetical protein
LYFRFLVVLQSLQTEYERIMSLKKDLEKQLEERTNELKTTKIVANSFTNQLKEKLEQITGSKVMNKSRVRYHSYGFFFSSRQMSMKTMRHYVYKFKN